MEAHARHMEAHLKHMKHHIAHMIKHGIHLEEHGTAKSKAEHVTHLEAVKHIMAIHCQIKTGV